MSYDLPTIDLTAEQKSWLKAVVEAFMTGTKVSTAELKIDLRREVSPGFDPKSIDGRLLDPDGITPTLLGLSHVQPNHPLINLTDRVIRYIRDEVLPSKVKSITAAQASEKLNSGERDIRLVFALMQSVGMFWDSASGMPPDGVGYQEVGFKYDYVIDAYLSYKGLKEALLAKERRKLEEQSRMERQRADVSSILRIQNIYGSLAEGGGYVSGERLGELRMIKSRDFDLTRLIRLIEELNIAYAESCWMSVAMLVRAIVDHVPPIFGKKTFTEVANNYGWNESHKREMKRLDESLRNVADAHLHVRVRRKEILPAETQVDFRAPVDVLLAEIVRLLK